MIFFFNTNSPVAPFSVTGTLIEGLGGTIMTPFSFRQGEYLVHNLSELKGEKNHSHSFSLLPQWIFFQNKIQSAYQKDNCKLEEFLFNSPNPLSPNTHTQISQFLGETHFECLYPESQVPFSSRAYILLFYLETQVSSLWIIWVLGFSAPSLCFSSQVWWRER